ncbi:hypothetical protein FB451DRAFT_1090776 [Mycena latifolia]|nr:hypothetical protein FB451DRAFT_1381172 [Mycena latifolia]KAJ7471134.1 hypothetical protein FB451DRAFT_1090776 [Mycena latifolia]
MDTPFKHILHTNAIPSDSECQLIEDLLATPQKEVAGLSEQIEQLSRRREELNSFIGPHRALVSLVRRLPDDVMQEIFIASLPANRNAIMSLAEAPLLLCNICSAWRNLAISTPYLWASLHIAAPATHRLLQMNYAIDTWLSRSGALPLSISIARHHAPGDVSTLIKTLIRFSRRWRHMKFILSSERGSYQSFAALGVLSPDDVPVLATVVIDGLAGWDSPVDDAQYHNLVRFASTPSVHSVALRCTSRPGNLPLRWDHLRRFTFGGPGTRAIVNRKALGILRQCPDLEACTLTVGDTTFGDAPMGQTTNAQMVRLEHLRQLCIIDRLRTSAFFSKLELPALRSLDYANQEMRVLPFLSLLPRTPTLVRLSVKMPHITTIALVEALQLVPGLEELSVYRDPTSDLAENSGVDDPLFALLTPTADGREALLCPRLQRIRLANFGADSGHTLLDFLRARGGNGSLPVARLQSIHLTLPWRMQLDVTVHIQPLVARGLHAVFRYVNSADALYSPSDGVESHDADWEPMSSLWDRGDSDPFAWDG